MQTHTMQTLTMQGIADLAQVQRPVVSVWRTRFARADHPFPSPVAEQPLRFDADEVARWLEETGHGNNSDARIESPLHSSATETVTADLERGSALLLLHQLCGDHLESLEVFDAVQLLAMHDVEPILDAASAVDALGDDEMRRAVDALAEAAFSGGRVLDRLVADFTAADGPWSREALTSAGNDLLGGILAELHRADPRAVVPHGHGGLVLAGLLAERLEEHSDVEFRYREDDFGEVCDLVAWRRIAARGVPVVHHDPGSAHHREQSRMHLMQRQSVEADRDFFEQVADALLDVGDHDVLVVVGPARLMTDQYTGRNRRALLAPSDSYTAPLRYVAPLPKGLSRFGGRRRLALWVFGRRDSRWTVVGSHSDAVPDRIGRAAIAADVAAALSHVGDIHAHAFRSSTVLASDHLLRQSMLTVPATEWVSVDGGDHLARVWELDRGLLTGVTLSATDAHPAHIGLDQATKELGRDLPGARIPDHIVGTPEVGWVTVIGPHEVRDPTLIGTRGIDRIVLEEVAPRARLTDPGDVVYVAAGGPAAIVDRHGGHVVAAPARIFRCLDAESHDRQLVPAVVAADIAAQPGTDRRTWRLRAVPVDRVEALDEVTRRIGDRRAQLLDELRDLDALDTELTDALAAGALSAQMNPSDSTKDEA
ncbi:MAG: DNA-binding protein [Rhodococcus sp. (in: high G+C Gram-positive bacteria)]|uniref:DNA-binding protein n=1 Tax=Rhodococcus sp. TaxID=1831 RepID=UPI003BB51C80